MPGYDLIRSDHPSNNKRGGVAIYNKNFLPLKLIDINCLKAGFQHADFSASADFYAYADFSAYPHMNFHHNADC